jgi:RNA binding exosome subunit
MQEQRLLLSGEARDDILEALRVLLPEATRQCSTSRSKGYGNGSAIIFTLELLE